MPLQGTPDEFVSLLHKTIAALIRRDGPDLTARQLGVFLRVYVYAGPQTGTHLALALNVPKSVISRVLDRLAEAELVCRQPNPADYRSVLAVRTVKGAALFREIRQIMQEAALHG
jgi:DNA-binding MarR family transcriptional regulator